jgi:membrane protein DedA with SNARE-associated domain
MLFAGFNVSEGHYSLVLVVLVGTLANLTGSWLAYAVGYYGRVDLIEKHGHRLFIKPHHMHAADRWFERHGDATVFFTRMMPVVRTFISLPAGAARMPFIRFSVLTFLGCLPWVFALAFVGKQVGANWTDWKDQLHYVDYAFAAAILAAIAYVVVRRLRRGPGAPPAEPAADAGGH